MNYCEWAAAYREDAGRILQVIEKKKTLLNDKQLHSDARKSLVDTIAAYRRIYYELLRTAEHLRLRGGQRHEA